MSSRSAIEIRLARLERTLLQPPKRCTHILAPANDAEFDQAVTGMIERGEASENDLFIQLVSPPPLDVEAYERDNDD